MSFPKGPTHTERYPFRRPGPDAEMNLKLPTVSDNEVSSSQSQSSGRHGGVTEIPGWQEEITIQNSMKKRTITIIVNLLILLFPLAYLALGITIAAFNDHPVHGVLFGGKFQFSSDNMASSINAAIKQAVTAWPIGFGVILCRVLKIFASYKAERGTRLMTLEQLMSSRSFGSTLLAPLTFKTFNVFMLALFALWSLSPIMTQALQNIFTIGINVSQSETHNVTYPRITAMPEYILDSNAAELFAANTAFLMSILSPIKQSERSEIDLWGNPKTPTIESVQQYPKDSQGWYLLENQSGIPKGLDQAVLGHSEEKHKLDYNFSSIVGLPIAGIQKNASTYGSSTRFKIETGYFTLDCSQFQEITHQQLNKTAGPDNGAWACPEINYGSNLCNPGDISPLYMRLRLRDYKYPEELFFASIVKRSAFTLSAHSKPTPAWYEATTCKISSQWVESELACAGRSCKVAKTRLSSDQALLKDDVSGSLVLILPLFVQASMPTGEPMKGSGGQMTLMQSWLANPAGPLQGTGEWSQDANATFYPNMSTIPIDIFNQRLAMLFNTYYQIGIAPTALMQGPQDDFSLPQGLSGNTTVAAEVHRYVTVYRCNMKWFGMLVFSCVVLLGLVMVGAFLSANVLGPDFMGYVSTLTYYNPYMAIPRGGSLMDGMERTRKLANLKVKLQDVLPTQPLGHAALSSVDGVPLQRGRTYR